MAITRIGATGSGTDNVTSTSLSIPSGTIDNDLIIWFGSCDGTSGYNLPTGFTEIFIQTGIGSHVNRAAYKIAASEPASYNITVSTGERGWTSFITYRGTDLVDPIDSFNTNTGNSNIPFFNAIIPTEDNSLVLAFLGTEDGNNTNPIVDVWMNGITEVIDNVGAPAGTGAASSAGAVGEEIQTTATTRGGSVQFIGSGGATFWGAHLIVIKSGVPPVIGIDDVDGDEILTNNQTNVVITGFGFDISQGNGKVEIGENIGYTGTIILQSVNNWADGSIEFDISSGVLANTNCFLFVTNDNGDRAVKSIQLGVPPLTYTDAILSLSPDHKWTFDNNFTDSIAGLSWTMRNGSSLFTAQPLTRGRTLSWTIDSQGIEGGPDNSTNINSGVISTRTMGGWIRISQVQDSFVMFYEEGGGINNIAFFMGMGGILIAQLADTGDDNVHAYSDFPLEPNRNYHILFRFDYNGTGRFELLIDGVVQSSSFGNPLSSTDLDSHTGDIAFGDSTDSLEVFGTDINFPVATTSYYQDWHTWTTFITDNQAREILFEQGVRGDVIIFSDTEINMQTAFNAYTDTIQPNSDCNFIIQSCTDGDFTLNADNIILSESSSIHVQYLGVDVLSMVNLNGSNFSKVSVINGGTVNIVNPAVLTISGLQPQTEIRIFEADTTNEVAGINSATGTWSTSLQIPLVDISLISLGFQNLRVKNVNTSSNTLVPVTQEIDRQYLNS
ncbi:hypothetical protein PANI_CDS0098 [Maribacter phage Panino]